MSGQFTRQTPSCYMSYAPPSWPGCAHQYEQNIVNWRKNDFNSTYVMMVCFFKGIISENAIFVIYKSHRLDYSNPKAWFKWSFFWLYERGNRLSRCNCVCVYSAGALPQCNWWRILKRAVWREGIVRLLTHVQYISTQNLHPLVHGKEIKLTGSQ